MRPLLLGLSGLLLGSFLHAEAPRRVAGPKHPPTVKELIDQLAKVSDEDIGYSAAVTGSIFLPLGTAGQVQTILLFQKPLARSGIMRELVKRGVAALPPLIAHLGDRRKTAIRVGHGFPVGLMLFGEELDRNERTDRPVKDRTPDAKEDDWKGKQHTVTVGDLCFVAIGQIVNRNFNAVRYQPTAILIVSSPTHSPRLRERVEQAWGSLTRDQHRASLVADFLKPDDEDRRIGACQRLAYYYPDALEPLALKFLARPTFDVRGVQDFVREQLYREKDPRRCRDLFEEFIRKQGEPSREGILLQLFHDLDLLEADEEKRLGTPLKEFAGFGTQPRQLLIHLYDKPKGVRSKDRPRFPDALADTVKSRLIEKGLVYDSSTKSDRAVRDLLVATGEDDYLARACLKRLIGRGYDADIEAYCKRRLPRVTDPRFRKEVREIRDRLGWTRLHVAVNRNDPDGVSGVLRSGAKVDAAARNGKTPLHLAAEAGHPEVVRLLVEAGASLDTRDRTGLTPVQLAVRNDQLEIVRFLAGHGCSLLDILTAAAAGRADLVEKFMRADAEAARARTKAGQTLLHLAAWAGQPRIISVLVAHGASLEATSQQRMTALHLAAGRGQDGVAQELLRLGANARATMGEEDVEPLHLAAGQGHARVVATLLKAKASPSAPMKGTTVTPLHLAAEAGHAEVVGLLLRWGASVDAADEKDCTPLHLAALMGRNRVAEQLLASRASVNAKDEAGSTPLHLAVQAGHIEMARLLLANKADRRAEGPWGRTPLDLARELKQAEIVRLLEAGGKKP